ncbi:MAG TPA: chromosome partitioning protein ParB [Gammaproteobacteria bacterium]|nr:chromosome partitioning protein ParB [Gammaproteobacteria bacterium]
MAKRTSPCPATNPDSQDAGIPADTQPWLVDLARIQPYDHNPRHGRNPEYDRIKDSIRSTGLDQPLVITQRPGAPNYMVHSGGNTRLMVLKELFEETGDPRYARVPCLLKPWSRESEVLLAHLRENDLRGDLTFIDKARAVCEARELIKAELGLDEISQRRLADELRKRGYRITHARISQMEYAVGRLLPVIPLALEHGLGRPQVEQIRKLEQAARTIWCERCDSSGIDFDEVFLTLCRRYDSPDWDTEVLRGALEAEIAEVLDVSIHTVRIMLDAGLAGRKPVVPDIHEPSENESVVPDECDEPPAPMDVLSKEVPVSDGAVDQQLTRDISAESIPDDGAPTDDEALDSERDQQPSPDCGGRPVTPMPAPSDGAPTDLKSLRGRAWTLATRLAQRNGMGELVELVSGKGMGFVLKDVPDPTLADQLDEESLSQLSMLWWQLAACSEMTFAPLASILPLLPEASILRRALETEDADLLFRSIWTLDPGHTGYRLWRRLDDQDWADLLSLMETYRRIRRLAADTGVSIWE